MAGSVIQGAFPHGLTRLPRGQQRMSGAGQAVQLAPSFTVGAAAGQPLPHDVRQKMERAFSTSFADVRVHVSPQPASLGAQAFTHGSNIHFAHGHYDPASPRGRQLLAHELAHVVQQRTGRARNPFGSGIAVLHDPALEAEAERLSARVMTASAPAPAPAPQAAAAGAVHPSRAVQPYWTLPSWKIYKQMPYFSRVGYPYAVIGNGTLAAQEPANGINGKHQFLTQKRGNTANVVNGSGVNLRISDDGNMAIEDTDLTHRQPKVFFATNSVIATSNNALIQVNSNFRLRATGNHITIGFWTEMKKLSEVTVDYLQNGNIVSPDLAPQNCNEIAGEVIGENGTRLGMYDKYIDEVGKLVPDSYQAWDDANFSDTQLAVLTQDYVNHKNKWFGNRLKSNKLNQYATPGVGHAFMIAAIGPATRHDDGSGTVRDLDTNRDIRAKWHFHFGGVVAQSGTDRITLENYARDDKREGNPDPRWYFQMYGEKKGQSFHEAHNRTGGYANAITHTAQPKRRKR